MILPSDRQMLAAKVVATQLLSPSCTPLNQRCLRELGLLECDPAKLRAESVHRVAIGREHALTDISAKPNLADSERQAMTENALRSLYLAAGQLLDGSSALPDVADVIGYSLGYASGVLDGLPVAHDPPALQSLLDASSDDRDRLCGTPSDVRDRLDPAAIGGAA